MSWVYTPIYWALLAICITQSCYPIFMLLAMLVRQSRLLYALFHKVDPTSKKHGGELVAQVFKSHGVQNIFMLPGGHVSPIVVASNKLNIKVVDVRHEATAVFAADASARMSGIPGVAVVTAGPGLTNTVTAIKNAQMAESPIVIISGAAATMLKNRGSLQDIDHISLLKSTTKKCFTVDCVRDITPTIREAFRVSQIDKPGPVFVELPLDILYPYQIVSEQFASMSSSKSGKKPSIKTRLIEAYTNYSLNHIFADAWKEQDSDPLPVTVKSAKNHEVDKVAEMLKNARKPLIIMGSQSTLRPYGPFSVAQNIVQLGIPMYLNGAARGLVDNNKLVFKHERKQAVKEADLVLLLGAICDFRLSYGRIFRKGTKIISVNRSISDAKLNSGIFWQPNIAIESDVAKFVADLTRVMRPHSANYDEWLETLKMRDEAKEESIQQLAIKPTEKYLNPLKVLQKVRSTFDPKSTIYIADGGDFVASASYILRPGGPLQWLDPGPFGTLGCGAGFALAAKLMNPDKNVVCIMGDGAFGYAIPEIDTFVRHKIPVICIIGNDACWTQIAREQLPMLGSTIGCDLAHTQYHKIADGFGAKGIKIVDDDDMDGKNFLENAKKELVDNKTMVVVNALIGKTSFRDGSISV